MHRQFWPLHSVGECGPRSFLLCCTSWHRKASALQFFHFSAVWQTHRKYLSPENKPDKLRGTCLCVPVMFVFASELSPPGVSPCHTESQAGWDEKTKGNRPPQHHHHPPFLCQAEGNELLNRNATAHGGTCVNRLVWKITTETHGVGTKRGGKFFENNIHTEVGGKILCFATTCTTTPPLTPNGLSVEQLHMATGRHGDAVIPLPPPLWQSPYPPCCGFYWATDSSSQPAPLWLLPAHLPLRSQLSEAWDCTSSRLHTVHRSLTHTHTRTQRSAGAVGKSSLILRLREQWEECNWDNLWDNLSWLCHNSEAVHLKTMVELRGGCFWRTPGFDFCSC